MQNPFTRSCLRSIEEDNHTTVEKSLTDFKLTKADFEGKKVVVYGDSITVPASKTKHISGDNYIDIIAKRLNFATYWNYALGGTSAMHSVSIIPLGAAKEDLQSGSRYVTENVDTDSIADYAIIMYGSNDWWLDGQVGSVDDHPATYRETNTFLGGIRFMIETLRAQNPKIKVLCFTNLWNDGLGTDLRNPRTGLSITEFNDALYELADELEYRIIDLFPVFNADNFTKGKSPYTSDGIHPTELGHSVLADYILKKEGNE